MDNNSLGLNEFLQPLNAPISNKQKQTQAVTFEKENILPTGYVNYTNLNQSTRPYTAVLSLSREAGTFDDIQEAINYVNLQGGGNILIKKGTYILNNDITMYSNIQLIGEDNQGCVFDAGFFDFGFQCTSLYNISFNSLYFQSKGGTAGFIDSNLTNNLTIQNCNFNDMDCGLSFTNSFYNKITNNTIQNMGTAIYSNILNASLIGYNFFGNSTAHIYSVASSFSTYIGNEFSGGARGMTGVFSSSKIVSNGFISSDYCIRLESSNRTIVSNNEMSGGKGVYFGTVSKSQLNGNNLVIVTSHGVTLLNSTSNQIGNNYISTFLSPGTNIYNGVDISSNSDKNSISGNYLEYGGTTGTYSLSIGVGCDFNAVAGNVLSGGTLDAGASNVWAGNAN